MSEPQTSLTGTRAPASARRPSACGLAALLLGALSLCTTACGEKAGGPAEKPQAARPRFQNLDPAVSYVGETVCRGCHFEVWASSSKTGMGRAFYPLTAERVVEDFTTNNSFVVEPSGLHYRMIERDGKYYQQQFMLDSAGRETALDEREMVWVIGSNHHSRSYVTVIDHKLFQAPACWYPDTGQWDLCPGYEFKNDHFAREITEGCINCHNGPMTLVEGERNRYEEPYPHGIGCERCHGPGALHVARWRGGETPTGEGDPTIVDVRRLPPEERIEVCFQCHLGDSKATERVMRWDRHDVAFRPGQRITDVVVPFRYVQQTRGEFGLSSQGDRLILSRCFKESGGKIECLTCHNPHVTIYHEERPPDHFRQRCLGCHAEADCKASAAARAGTAPLPDDCVQCHMRRAEPDDQRFTEFTDHWIRRDLVAGKEDHRTSFEVEPVFPDRFAALPAGEQAFYRARAKSLLARDVPTRLQAPIWAAAERDFEQAISSGFDNAQAWFFLGSVRGYQNRDREAAEAYERAYARDPGYDDAAYAVALSLVKNGELDRAMQVLRGMQERNPRDTKALAEIARVQGTAGRHAEALESFDRAIALEPWQVSLVLNKAKVLASSGRFAEAATLADTVVRLDPDNPDVWLFYQKANEAAGRMDRSAEGQRFVQRLAALKAKNVGG